MKLIIPLVPEPQTFLITLESTEYRLTVHWNGSTEGGWVLGIARANGEPLVGGIPIVTGANLLEHYAYLGLGGMIWCSSADDLPPGPDDLGIAKYLVFEVGESAS